MAMPSYIPIINPDNRIKKIYAPSPDPAIINALMKRSANRRVCFFMVDITGFQAIVLESFFEVVFEFYVTFLPQKQYESPFAQ